jgi:penicillin-binding protein 1A
LKDLPIDERPVPEGILQVGGDYYYAENPPGAGVRSLGLGERSPTEEEKTKDEVKNELF